MSLRIRAEHRGPGRTVMHAAILGGVAWNTMVDLGDFPSPHPHTLFADGMHRAVGSSGAGKALNLASLGVEVDLWAMIGDDEPGARIRKRLNDAGVRFHGSIDPLGTAEHINLMNRAGQRISIFANPGSLSAMIDPEPMRSIIESADVVAVTILDHCRPFLPIAASAAGDLWIDLHDYDGANQYHEEFIEAADALIMSSVAMPDWRTFLEDQVSGGKHVAIATHGDDGAAALTVDDGWVEVEAIPATVVDTNGAGDAFLAGFVVAWGSGADLATAMRAGAQHASLAVSSRELAPRPRGHGAHEEPDS